MKRFKPVRHGFLFLTCFVLVCGCKERSKNGQADSKKATPPSIEAITLLGDTLVTPAIKDGKAKTNYQVALERYQKYPDSAEAIIWYGRRSGYLGHYQKAITIFTEGITKFPNDARMYRHRGHRYISTRNYEKAIADFEKAADLIKGQPDRVEPDGIPNAKNIPISSLQGNIWYHLGLAYYLNGNLPKAQNAFSQRATTNKNDDNLVSGGHWLYMILRRMNNEEEALNILANINKNMDIIENTRYYEMCLFYKGQLTEDQLKMVGDGSSSDDVYYYGLGNWYLYEKKDTITAKRLYKRLLTNGNPFSFAYLAAEADWARIFEEPIKP